MKTKLLSLFAAIIMAATTSAQFSGSGSGTKTDPYLIFNPIQLDQVRNFLNNENVYFKMMADIDLKEFIADNYPTQGWLPIGTSTSPFQGKFDGNNKKISHLSINRPTVECIGLFGVIDSWATITNVSVEGDVVGREYVGGIVGYVHQNGVGKSCTIDGVSMKGIVFGTSNIIGGIVGYVDSYHNVRHKINNCVYEGKIHGKKYAGGIIGAGMGFSIENSFALVDILIQSDYVGGIIGHLLPNDNSSIIRYCGSCGMIIGGTYIGGIAGHTTGYSSYNKCNIYDNYFHGILKGKDYVGGICGYSYNSNIFHNYSVASIWGNSNIGGCSGYLGDEGSLIGSVAINDALFAEVKNIGRIYGSRTDNSTIGEIGTDETNKSLNKTEVFLCGIKQKDILDDLQNGQSVGNTILKYKATYQGIGWDFTNIWDMQETESYPYFQWQAAPPIINSAKSGEITVTGKGTDGATIEVTIGDSTYQTICSGYNWTVTTNPLVAGSIIYARAKTSDKKYSYRVSQRVDYIGAGTEADPYKIYTAEELANINGEGNFKVMNDIDLSYFDTWTPIGQYEIVTANLDGDNHTISGLNINTTDNYQGLFAQCDGSTIKNIKLSITTCQGGNYTGALVSMTVGGEITNCQITGNVSGGEYTGGLVGYSQDTKITDCSVKGNVVGTTFVGGLAAFASGEVSQSQYQGEVSSTTASAVVGGLIGNNNANISECRSQGKVTCTANNSMVGGLVGTNNDTIINCYSESEITANQYAGGLVGYNYGFVQYGYAKGNITSTSVAGGLVGYNDGTKAIVKNCSAMNPSINATSSTGIAIRVIGGIKNSAPTPEMNNYALKTMAVSVNGVAQTIYDDNLHGASKTDAVLKQSATYSGLGWNMSSIWGINEGSGYPYLQKLYLPVITVKGEHGTVTGGGEYKIGTEVTLTATPDEHYSFVKWSDGSTQATRTIIVTGDATYTAEFKADQYTITATATNGSVTGAGTYDYGTQVTLEVIPNAHYHLVQWSDGLTALSRTLIVTNDSTLSAECAINQFTISVSGTNGTVTGGGTYNYGQQATLTAVPNQDMVFLEWSDGVKTNPRVITVTKEAQYEAIFVASTYAITVLSGDDAMGYVTGGGEYAYNTEATITATAYNGSKFQSWDDGNMDNPRTIVVTGNATFIATFDVTTVMENMYPNNKKDGKTIINGNLYILRDGVYYNAQGAVVE